MATYQNIKAGYQKNIDNLINQHKGFFAFNEKQVIEGMEKIGVANRNELTSLPMGMIMPKSEVESFLKNMETAELDYKKAIKQAKEEKEKAILYELHNHECFYTGSFEEVINIFKGIYSASDIKKIYLKNIQYSE